MSLGSLLLYNLGIVAALMVAIWLFSLLLRNVSIVDIFWGLGFVLVAVVSAWLSPVESERKWLITGLVVIWGLRLAAYLAYRNIGQGEDYRYRSMREKVGKHFWIVSLATVFGLQGVIMWVVSLPVQAGMLSAAGLNMWDAAGAVLWAVGVSFEAVGDYQLARFKADRANRGMVFDRGLWKYTRHPNYFGDFLVWWGIYLVACGSGAAWTAISPLLMSFLLMRVSGVTLLERSLKSRTKGYEAYVRRTSAFFPWPPQRADL